MKSLNNYISEKLVINKNFVSAPMWDGVDTMICIIFNSYTKSVYMLCFKKCSISTTSVHQNMVIIDDWKIALRENEQVYRSGTYVITNDGFLYEEKDNFFNIVLEPLRYDKKIKEFIETFKHNETYNYKDILGHFGIKNIDHYTGYFNRTSKLFSFDNIERDDNGVLQNITN